MKQILFLALLFAVTLTQAQVGIGTETPDSSAVLDVSSTNKGMMLPRLNDTSSISKPREGLMMYDRQMRAPAFHDGTKWNTVANRATTSAVQPDSLTYTITFAAPGFTNGTFGLMSLTNSVIGGGTADTDLQLVKGFDINSNAITKAVIVPPSKPSMVIEFKAYFAGSTTPSYSIKLKNFGFNYYQVGLSSGGSFAESCALTGTIIGYKDWVNNVSFAYDKATRTFVPY